MGRLAEEQKRQLLSLLGPEVPVEMDFRSNKVCWDYLLGNCLHDLFSNTRLGLGVCPKIHDTKLRADFEACLNSASTSEDDVIVLENIHLSHERTTRRFVSECDDAIRKHNKRLDKTPEENKRAMALMKDIADFGVLMSGTLGKAEELGEQGLVEESQREMKKLEALKEEKEGKEQELKELTETAGASGQQRLRVCETCGAYLSILDSDRRLADHFGGKMHLGYAQMREYLEKCRKDSCFPEVLKQKRKQKVHRAEEPRKFDSTEALIRHTLSRKRKSPVPVPVPSTKPVQEVEDGEEGEIAD